MAKRILPDAEKQRREEITRGILAGDRQAYEQFFADTQQRGVYYAFKMLQNWHDAEDIVQQTYTEIIDCIHDGKALNNIYSYYWKFLHWRCQDKIKKNEREQSRIVQSQMETDDGGGLTLLESVPEDKSDFLPMEALLQKDKSDAVLKAIDTLPEQQKAAISLRYMAEQSIEETAYILKKAPGTIKNQIFEAKQKLQKAVGAPEQFYSLAGLPVLTRIFEQEIQIGGYSLSAAALESLHEAAKAAAGTTEAATAATTTAAGTSAATTITTGAGIMGKIAALAGTKAAIAAAAAVVIVGGSSAGVYVHHQNEVKQAEAAAIVQQEEQARLDAEQAAQEAAELKAKEEEAARKAEAEQLAAKAEAERKAAEEAEAQAAAQATLEQAEAEEAAREAQEQAAAEVKAQQQEQGGGTTGGAADDGWNPEGLPSTGPVESGTSSPGGGAGKPGGSGSLDNLSGSWVGKPEPSGTPGNKMLKSGDKWDSSLGGWVAQESFGKLVIFPDGNMTTIK